MAQASSAQREPSMEEILASIRRIIEDNESGRKDRDEKPDASSARSDAGEVETFRAELKPATAPQSQATADEDEPVVEAEEEEGPSLRAFEWLRQETREPSPADEAGRHAPEADQTSDMDEEEAATPAAAPHAPELSRADREAPQTWRRPQTDEPVSAAQAVASVSQPQPSESVRPAILSEMPGRKVAAAFEELSEAFEASRRKSLAEAAEQMLRPMLQEWLDNNLPQLVEKLVREEIERVARGT